MKKLLILLAILSGCSTIPPENYAKTSSLTLCKEARYMFNSAEKREAMLREVESRGKTCTYGGGAPYMPPPAYNQQPRQVNKPVTTNCHKVGDNVECNSY